MKKRLISMILVLALVITNVSSSVVFALDELNSYDQQVSNTEKDITAPTISLIDGGINRKSATEVTIKFNCNEIGQAYYSFVEKGEKEPAIDTTGKGTAVSIGENTIAIDNLTSGAKDVYIKVKDEAENISNTLKINVEEENIKVQDSLLQELYISTSSNPTKYNSWLWAGSEKPEYDNVAFSSNLLNYTLKEQSSNDEYKELYFRAKPVEEGATVKLHYTNEGEDKELLLSTNGEESNLVELNYTGNKKFRVEVTPPKGSSNKTTIYNIEVLNKPKLNSLEIKHNGMQIQLSPKFSYSKNEYEVTVPETYKTIDVNATSTYSKSKITYNGKESSKVDISSTDKIDVSIIGGNGEESVTNTYTIKLIKSKAARVKFNVTPSDATVLLYNKKNNLKQKASADNDFDALLDGTEYNYVVSKYGYVSKKGEFKAGELKSEELNITLDKAPDNTLEQVSAQWKNFRNSDENMSVTGAPLPTKPEETILNWAKEMGQVGTWDTASVPLIVDDCIISMTAESGMLKKVSLETGEIIKEVKMDKKCNWGYTPPTYAEGMIFVPLAAGTIQAFNAKTLEPLWVYHDKLKGQSLCPITYSDGYIYTGFWNSETANANYVCLSVTDEDVTKPDEEKEATWYHTTPGGYYWAGSVVVGDSIIFGTDDGRRGFESDSAHIYSLNKYTGEVISDLPIVGDQRSTIAYDKENNKVYFTTKCGYIYYANVDEKTGELTNLTGKTYNAQSTSTPVVYKGRVYIGYGSGISSSGSSGTILVVDANTLDKLYDVDMPGYPQCSMLLCNAYEKETGEIYIYSTYNNMPGGISMIKTTNTATAEDNIKAIDIYNAKGYEQYCICSLICDEKGNMYYRNDTRNMFSVGKNDAYLTELSVEGGNAILPEFKVSDLEYEAKVDKGTEEIKIKVVPAEGAQCTINGEKINSDGNTIKLKDCKGSAEIKVVGKKNERTYTINVREKNHDATLSKLVVNNSNGYNSFMDLTPEFNPNTLNYEANYDGTISYLNIWPKLTDSNATIKLLPISGNKDEGEIEITDSTQGDRYAIYFADNSALTKTKIEVIAEDGVTKNDYIVNLTRKDIYPPELTLIENSVKRHENRVTMKVNLSEDAEVFYEVVEKGAKEPTIDTSKKGISGTLGENNINIENVDDNAKDIYFVAKDKFGNVGKAIKVEVEKNNLPNWEDVIEKINAEETSEIEVNMKDATVVPKEVLDSIKGKNIFISFKMGEDIAWTIKGTDVDGADLKNIDLSVEKNSNNIPEDTIKDLFGKREAVQLNLTHNGEFGFTATLKMNLGVKNAGKYAYLFYYNTSSKELEKVDDFKVNSDGKVEFKFNHASDYVVVIDDKPMITEGKVTINYKDEKGKKVKDTEIKSYKLGKYTFNALKVEGYEPIESIKQVVVTADKSDIEITFTYRKLQQDYTTKRLAGENRYLTAIEIAKASHPGKLDNVILTSAKKFPDALSGSVLAAKYDAPILLVDDDQWNNTETIKFIKSNLSKDGNIFILGGTSVVPDSIINTLKAAGFNNFERLGGIDRYETNLIINSKLNVAKGTDVMVANSSKFADGLSASGIAGLKGMPIYLTEKDSMEENTLNAIKNIEPKNIYVLGGTMAVSKDVEKQLNNISKVIRIGGVDRYETSIEIAKYFNLDTAKAVIASGLDFPDALTGSLFAAKNNAPIILVEQTNDIQKKYLDSTDIRELYILGGNRAISNEVVTYLTKK